MRNMDIEAKLAYVRALCSLALSLPPRPPLVATAKSIHFSWKASWGALQSTALSPTSQWIFSSWKEILEQRAREGTKVS